MTPQEKLKEIKNERFCDCEQDLVCIRFRWLILRVEQLEKAADEAIKVEFMWRRSNDILDAALREMP